MSNMSRRSFLTVIAGGAVALSTSLGHAIDLLHNPVPIKDKIDLILLNGKIITVDRNDTIAEAVAVRDGKIAAVGATQDIRVLAGVSTHVIDLGGKCVTPGLVDSHIHIILYGKEFREGALDIRFPKAGSKKELLRLVEMRAKEVPKGEWIAGNQGFNINVGDAPSRSELDAVAPNHPVYLRHFSGQFAVVNSLALKVAGVNRTTRDPYGGNVGRDTTSGEPNGLLFHYSAENLIHSHVPGYGVQSETDRIRNAREGQRRALAAGYTSAQDVIVTMQEDIDAYRRLARDGGLKMRLYIMQYLSSEQQALKMLPQVRRFKDEWLTFGGWKLAVDGGPGAGTSLMYDRGLRGANRSYLYHDQPTLDRIVLRAHKSGLQLAFHATGDRAIDMAINAVEAALNASPRENHRHRIEHLQFPTRQALERIKRLGMVVSTSPQWITFHADGYRQLTNDATMERSFPLRTMMEMGIPIAFGCDVPATIMIEPKWALLGAVNRTTRGGYTPAPEQRISIRDALRMHTLGSAYASFEENIKGSIESGKLADMVVWSHDVYTASPGELRELKPLTTIVGGNIVYE
jgi:predicted amidohydrolase YtcJ